MNDVQKPPKRRGPKSQVKSWLLRPGTIKMAFAIVRLIALIAKVIDSF